MSTQPKTKLLGFFPHDPTMQYAQPPLPHTMRLLWLVTDMSMLVSLAYLYFRLKSVRAMPQPDIVTLAVLFVEISTAGIDIR